VHPEETVVKRLLAEVCAIDVASIRNDAPLIEYGLDSARAIDLLVGLEAELNIRISDADAARMRTVNDLVVYVRAAKGAK